MAATITVAAYADTTLDLARRFLHAVNTNRPSRYEDMTPFGRRWPHS